MWIPIAHGVARWATHDIQWESVHMLAAKLARKSGGEPVGLAQIILLGRAIELSLGESVRWGIWGTLHSVGEERLTHHRQVGWGYQSCGETVNGPADSFGKQRACKTKCESAAEGPRVSRRRCHPQLPTFPAARGCSALQNQDRKAPVV